MRWLWSWCKIPQTSQPDTNRWEAAQAMTPKEVLEAVQRIGGSDDVFQTLPIVLRAVQVLAKSELHLVEYRTYD